MKMAKRRLDDLAVTHVSDIHFSDSDINYSDSENAHNNTSIKSRRHGKRIRSQTHGKFRCEQIVLPKEEDEHSYSCVPIFSKTSSIRDNLSGCSSESERENEKLARRRRVSERSTSSESIRSGRRNAMTSGADYSTYSSNCSRAKCSTKNAIMARMNRLRKKEYVTGLENEVKCLKDDNSELKTKLIEQQELLSSLRNEVQYLRGVLANSKEIGILLRRVCGDDNSLKMTSSVINKPPIQSNEKLSDITDEDLNDLDWPLSSSAFDSNAFNVEKILHYDTPINESESSQAFGVCLHVANKQVSLEFCASCNHSASVNNDYVSVK
ncbi:uncharacterized protein LOC142331157 [Lycorma delicatula]|uniref:uncharacterized protein LOC142331157 n=1 Tax=Lycorma delicatula TaxID=130591 RepID=UPI003F510051